MTKFICTLLIVFFTATSKAANQSAQVPVGLDDFAFGVELELEPLRGVQTVLLTEEIYRSVHHPDMRDLRVFNGAGEEVPHAVRTIRDRTLLESDPVVYPLFPVHGDPSALGGDGELALQVRHSANGRLLEVKAKGGALDSDDRVEQILAYIIDLGDLERSAVALELRLPGGDQPLMASYAIEASEDLSSWSPLVQRATLARIDHEGEHLQQNSVVLPATRAPYLRLRWLDGAPAVKLEWGSLEFASEEMDVELRSLRLQGSLREGSDHEFDFPSTGPLPVHRLQIHLPSENTLIRASIKNKGAGSDPWRVVTSGQFFRMNQGVEITSTPVQIQPGTAVDWSIDVSPQGGGLGKGSPELELFYYQEQLAFLARGEGPFTLAYGARAATKSGFNWGSVVRTLAEEQRAEMPLQSVVLGNPRVIAGEAALVEPPVDLTTTYILWGILITGVVLLAGACVRLLKQLNSEHVGA